MMGGTSPAIPGTRRCRSRTWSRKTPQRSLRRQGFRDHDEIYQFRADTAQPTERKFIFTPRYQSNKMDVSRGNRKDGNAILSVGFRPMVDAMKLSLLCICREILSQRDDTPRHYARCPWHRARRRAIGLPAPASRDDVAPAGGEVLVIVPTVSCFRRYTQLTSGLGNLLHSRNMTAAG